MSDEQAVFSIVSEQTDRLFRDLMTRDAQEAASRGQWQPALWQAVEDAALPLALVPEAQGGSGLDAPTALEIIRLAGYRGLPLPLGDTLAARDLWARSGGDLALVADRPVLLAEDARTATLRFDPGQAWLSGITAKLPGCGGAPCALLFDAVDGAGAHHLVCLDAAALTGSDFASPGLEPRSVRVLDGVRVAPEHVRPWQPGDARAWQALGAVVRSIEMLGALQRCLELGVQYAQERVQFGRTIAQFSPVQDMLVEAAAEVTAAAGAASYARERWRLPPDADMVLGAAIAKSRVGEAAGRVAALIHQVHGAIGFTQEHVLHQFTRRLWAWRDEFGTESDWNDWLGERACAAGGDALWPTLAAL